MSASASHRLGRWSTLARAAGTPAWAVPTSESLGLYYNRAIVQGPCLVHYRIAETTAWQEGPLVYNQRERQYRGSPVGLRPNAPQAVRHVLDGGRRQPNHRLASDPPERKVAGLLGDEAVSKGVEYSVSVGPGRRCWAKRGGIK